MGFSSYALMMMIMIRGMFFVIFTSKFHIEAGSYCFILDGFLRHFFCIRRPRISRENLFINEGSK